MDASLIIPALFFATIAIAIIAYVLRVIYAALGGGNPFALFEKWSFKRKQRILAEANIENQVPLEQAVKLCRSAFFLAQVKYNPSLVERVTNHNLDVLNKLVTMADRRTGHLANLPVVESLFASRADLMKAHIDVRETVRKLAMRKDKGGRGDAPDWARAEFSKKSDEIKEKIAVNGKSLEAQLDELISSLLKLPAATEITYH